MIDYISSSANLNFREHILPWSEIFGVKNKNSEVIALSSSFAITAGYKNPINYLGNTEHALKSPAKALAETFIAQDKDIIQTKNEKAYIVITTCSDQKLKIYFMKKTHSSSHAVCNIRVLNAGIIAQQLHHSIKSIAPKYHNNINKCYEIVDSYADLSVRETQVMHYLMQRKSSTDIGKILKLSNRTIQHYVESIKLKMFCNTTPQLVELGLYLDLNEMVPASLVY